MVALLAVGSAAAWVDTDQDDYAPGSVVTISGGNDDGGAPGYVAGNEVNVAVSGPNGWSSTCSATIAEGGSWSCTVTLDSDPAVAVGDYSYTATSTNAEGGEISENGTFTDGNAASTSGTVTDSSTSLPIEGATVTCTTTSGCNANFSTTTDASGNFLFDATHGGGKLTFAGNAANLTLTASKTGYTSNTVTFSASNGGTYTGQNIALTPSATPPAAPGAPYLNAGSTTPNNTGNFQVDWAASSTSGVTYELQKRDADDADWTSVVLSNSSLTNQAFSGEAEGSWKYQVRAAKSGLFSSYATNASPIVTVDKTAPNAPTATATTSPDYTDGSSHNWWKDTVTVGFTANGDPTLSDGSAGSGVNASTLSAAQTFTTLGLNTASGTVQDNAGNTSTAGTLDVYVDDSKPVVQFTDCPASPVFLGSSASVNWTASDTGSGLATAASESVALDTSTVGPNSVDAPTASDNVGHTSDTTTCSYSVIFNFHGFFQPVDNGGVFNIVKAGQGIPMKFDLSGDQGLNIFMAGYPKSTQINCSSSADEDLIESTVTAGGSSLNYDGTVNLPYGQYIYVWKTDKAWAGKCRQFQMKLIDGETHTANFKFTR